MIPRGLRNNNPLNIRHSADSFQGEIKGEDKAFKTFISMAYGYRAAFVTLATYLSRGLKHNRKDCCTVGATQRKQHSRLHRQSRKILRRSTQQGTDRRRWCGLHYDRCCNELHGKRQKC